jgi:hypothetical protein
MRRLKRAASASWLRQRRHFRFFSVPRARREAYMDAAAQRSVTTRRRFLHHGVTLAGAAALPAGGAGALAATPNAAVRLAQAGAGTAASPSAITVKSTRVAGSAINYAYAVKAGPWVFLNGHEAFDFERGLAAEVEGPPGNRLSGRPPLRREADYLLRRMRAILKEFGTDLSNAVRVDQFYTVGRRYRPITSRASLNSAATSRPAPRSLWSAASRHAPTSTHR